jgi:hypothetical protein
MYYVWCMMCFVDWVLYQELSMYLCYSDMFYIQLHRLAKKEYQYEIQYGLNVKVV